MQVTSPAFVTPSPNPLITPVGAAANPLFLAPETGLVRQLAADARLDPAATERVQQRARALITHVRASASKPTGLDAFLREYHLGCNEGVILMCLAEAMLRIPDSRTVDRLIADKIPAGAWDEHLGNSESLFVNASTWGLLLTGRIVKVDRERIPSPRNWLLKLTTRLGEPLVRAALRQAMRLLGHQFVMGHSIESALERTRGDPIGAAAALRYSFDMLGESAITAEDSEHYLEKYHTAIEAIGKTVRLDTDLIDRPSISVKLSALHPRYEWAQSVRVLEELAPRLESLVAHARGAGIGLTVDAEEVDRLELSLLLIDRILTSAVLDGYPAFGLAVQAYQRRATHVIRWLTTRARELNHQITVRLVKGAYWDSEVKRAQEKGLASYPVFTRKTSTDVSYLACARLLAGARDVIYPQFATHNAHTIAYIAELFADASGGAADRTDARAGSAPFEYQRLHGMGEPLYEEVLRASPHYCCRTYAPVGPHAELLPYLVRRLLENGANTSFVNRLNDVRLPIDAIAADPILQTLVHFEAGDPLSHPRIVDPPHLYGHERPNSRGINLADDTELCVLKQACESASDRLPWLASALIDGCPGKGTVVSASGYCARDIYNPAELTQQVGRIIEATATDAHRAIQSAAAAFPAWESRPAPERATLLMRAAAAFEEHRAEFLARLTLEAGKTLPDGIAELREAVDFLRYYAAQARLHMGDGGLLPGPTGDDQRPAVARQRDLRLHQPLEFPARHLHRPGRRGARCRQHSDCQTRRANPAHRRTRGSAAACRRHPTRSAPFPPWRRRYHRRYPDPLPPHRRHSLHRLHRDRKAHRAQPRRPRRPHRNLHRRNRRHQRDDRRQLGVA